MESFLINNLIYRYGLSNPQAQNLYAYVENRPISWFDPMGLMGLALDAGGGYGTGWGQNDPGTHGVSAGTGIYFGAKKSGRAEIGGFTYQSQGKTPGARLGLGLSLTIYYTAAERFFKGTGKYTSITLGPVTLIRYENPCGKMTGWTISLLGRGFGLTYFEEGTSRVLSSALQ